MQKKVVCPISNLKKKYGIGPIKKKTKNYLIKRTNEFLKLTRSSIPYLARKHVLSKKEIEYKKGVTDCYEAVPILRHRDSKNVHLFIYITYIFITFFRTI